jgi:hypothetical protein
VTHTSEAGSDSGSLSSHGPFFCQPTEGQAGLSCGTQQDPVQAPPSDVRPRDSHDALRGAQLLPAAGYLPVCAPLQGENCKQQDSQSLAFGLC